MTYRHGWSRRVRSTFAFGTASVDVIDRAPDDAFHWSVFGLANLMVSPLPYLTWGFESHYGLRVERNGGRQDNHRVIFGVQVF